MEGKRISVIEAIKFGFKAILEHIRLFFFVFMIGSGLIVLVVGVLGFLNMGLFSSFMSMPAFQTLQECIGSNCLTIAYHSGGPLLEFVASNFLQFIISFVMGALFLIGLDFGLKTIALSIYDTRESTVKTLWSRFSLVGTGFLSWMLYCIMVWVGFMFFIIPGFILLLRFGFFPFFIIDKNMNTLDALKESYEVTREPVWDIFAFWMIVKIIMSIGYFSIFGIILTWPLSTLAYAHVYRQLVPCTRVS